MSELIRALADKYMYVTSYIHKVTLSHFFFFFFLSPRCFSQLDQVVLAHKTQPAVAITQRSGTPVAGALQHRVVLRTVVKSQQSTLSVVRAWGCVDCNCGCEQNNTPTLLPPTVTSAVTLPAAGERLHVLNQSERDDANETRVFLIPHLIGKLRLLITFSLYNQLERGVCFV